MGGLGRHLNTTELFSRQIGTHLSRAQFTRAQSAKNCCAISGASVTKLGSFPSVQLVLDNNESVQSKEIIFTIWCHYCR